MNSTGAALSVRGSQQPRIHLAPPYVSSAGPEIIEAAELAGLFLDPWEKLAITDGAGETADGRWAAYRVGLEVPRQNGKGAILEAREIGGLFALEEKLIIHSAHEQATASEHFRRILNLMEGVPEFDRRILKVVRGKGLESIELRGGSRIFFKTRTGGGGRGFTGDLVVFDEAMILAAAFMAALVPTMAARSIIGDPQLWFAGSAVDQQKTEHGFEFARVRADALAGIERLAYFGWNLPYDGPDDVPDDALDDPACWAQANPGLGIRISAQYVADERRALGSREFAVERLGVGDWPSPDGGDHIIPFDVWDALEDQASKIEGVPDFAIDVSPDRSSSTIAASGVRSDKRYHFEVVDRRRGTGWVSERAAELVKAHGAKGIVIDGAGPGAALIPELEKLGVKVTPVTAQEHARACGTLFDAAVDDKLRHLGTPELTAAVRGAVKRPLGDAWALSRKSSAVDISPLVASTLALWGTVTRLENRVPLVAWA
jgi:hypothetical protein